MAYDYPIVTTNESTAVKKAKKAFVSADKTAKKAEVRYNASRREIRKYSSGGKNETPAEQIRRLKRLSYAQTRSKANKKGYDRANARRSKANKKLKSVQKTLKNATDIANKISEQDSGWNNEGKCAIYPTSDSSTVIFISPSDAEKEDNSTDVTSWPVDKGAPRSSYARVSSKTVTVEGILTGSNGDNAHDKYITLRKWHSDHTELTYRGDIYYKHLIITSLSRDFKGLVDNLNVSITFTFVRAAEVTTSKNKKHKKSSKSSKTTAGNRNKKYTAMTVKSGDTLYQLSKKYGRSVSWLAKVNKIKNPNVIYTGQKIRVR